MDLDVEFSSHTTLVRERHNALYKVSLISEKVVDGDGRTVDPLAKLWRKARALRKRVSSNSEEICQDAIMLLTPESLEFYTSLEDGDLSSSGSSTSVTHSGSSFTRVVEWGTHKGARGLERLNLKKEKSMQSVEEASTSGRHPEMPDSAKSRSSFEGHCFSVGVAISQVLRVSKRGRLVTLYYILSGMCGETLSSEDGDPLHITFEATDEDEAREFIATLEKAMDRFVNAMLLLGKGFPLMASCQAVAVTHSRRQPDTGRPLETIVSRHPDWGMAVPAPASWTAEAGDSGMTDGLQVYLATPLGSGTAQITQRQVVEFWDGGEASFFVTVSLATDFRQLLSLPSRHMVRRTGPGGSDGAAPLSEDGPGGGHTPPPRAPQPADRDAPGRRGGTGQQVRLHVCAERQFRHGHNRTSVTTTANGVPTPFAEPANASPPSPTPALTHPPAAPRGNLVVAQPVLHLQLAVAAAFIGAFSFLINFSGLSWQLYAAASLLSVACAACAAAAAHLEADIGPSPAGAGGGGRGGDGGGRGPARVEEPYGESEWSVTLVKAEVVKGLAWVAAGRSHERAPGLLRKPSLIEQVDGRTLLAKRYGFTVDTIDRFFQGYKGDPIAAEKALETTYAFRKANNAFDIMQQPQPHFDMFKDMFTHGVLCLAKDGAPVWVIKAGEMKKGFASYKASGATERDVARHLLFCQDFIYGQLDPRPLPSGRSIWVMDLKGIGLSDVGSSAMAFGLNLMGLMEKHYPERLAKAYIVNIPSFFSLLWRIAEPLTPPATRERLRVLRRKEDIFREMSADMDADLVPVEWGGQNSRGVYDSEEERALRDIAYRLNSGGK